MFAHAAASGCVDSLQPLYHHAKCLPQVSLQGFHYLPEYFQILRRPHTSTLIAPPSLGATQHSSSLLSLSGHRSAAPRHPADFSQILVPPPIPFSPTAASCVNKSASPQQLPTPH